MKNFFKLMWRRGWKILLIVGLFWLALLFLNFMFPEVFRYSNRNNVAENQIIEGEDGEIIVIEKEKTSFRTKIYNMFFNIPKLSIIPDLNFKGEEGFELDDENENPEENKRDKNQQVVLGYFGEEQNNRGQTVESLYGIYNQSGQETELYWVESKYIDISKLKPEGYYISPNSTNSTTAKNFYFGQRMVMSEAVNDIYIGDIIKGDISIGYLTNADRFLTIIFYNDQGEKIFKLDNYKSISKRDSNYLEFELAFNPEENFMNKNTDYKGAGYMVIWPDFSNVEGLLITKINIK